jgi:outer membrane PBP1 activator LpoA protein
MKGLQMLFIDRRILLIAAMILLVGVAGCGDDQKTAGKDAKGKAPQAVDNAVTHSKQEQYKFLKELAQHWNSLKGDVDQLQDKLVKKSKQAGEKASAHWEAISAEIKVKQEAVGNAFEELSQSSGDAYEKAKKKLEAALAELKAAYEKAAAELQKKTG